jgi:uncharacterized protein
MLFICLRGGKGGGRGAEAVKMSETGGSVYYLTPIKTPCIGVCSTGIGDSVCRGCKRFAHEVIDWNGYSHQEKSVIDQRLAKFLAICVANRFRIIDHALLNWQLEVQKIRFQPHHDAHCHVFAMLKAGASQITDAEQFGFEVVPGFRDRSMVALRDEIDEEFWVLSTAHYDRYIATSDLFSHDARGEAGS